MKRFLALIIVLGMFFAPVAFAGPSAAPTFKSAPALTTRPTVAIHNVKGRVGTLSAPAVGDVLVASTGGWTNNPTSYTYDWQRCNSSGASCVSIAGSSTTSGSYTIASADSGDTLRVGVIATNGSGASAETFSAVSAVVGAAGATPVNTLLPALSGSAAQGSVITLTVGTFSNETSQTGYWEDCPTASSTTCTATNPSGGTSYTLATTDPVGNYLRLEEIATNANGTTTVWSNAIGPITAGSPPAGGTLPWEPSGYPSYSGYTTVNITTADESTDPYTLNLTPGVNYNVVLPSTTFVGAIEILYGNNINIIGGSISVPTPPDGYNNDGNSEDEGLLVERQTGTVHVEGVNFTCQQGSDPVMCDGINTEDQAANIVLENDRAVNLWGTYSNPKGAAPSTGEHADVIETWGGANKLDVDNFTGSGDYQGFTVGYDLYSNSATPANGGCNGNCFVGSYDLRNVNLVNLPIPSAHTSFANGGGKLFLVTSYDTTCRVAGPMWLTNFYIDDESNGEVPIGSQTWPTVNSGTACSGSLSGTTETWPNLTNITGGGGVGVGHVTLATPPGGDFVPAGVAGVNYVSPGYSSTNTSSQSGPVVSVAPAITGTDSVGSVLTATAGTWSGSPTFAYQWSECPTSCTGSNATTISGATSATYTLQSGDAGDVIYVAVTATNADGSTVDYSAVTPVITTGSGGGNGTSVFHGTFSTPVTTQSNYPTLYATSCPACSYINANEMQLHVTSSNDPAGDGDYRQDMSSATSVYPANVGECTTIPFQFTSVSPVPDTSYLQFVEAKDTAASQAGWDFSLSDYFVAGNAGNQVLMGADTTGGTSGTNMWHASTTLDSGAHTVSICTNDSNTGSGVIDGIYLDGVQQTFNMNGFSGTTASGFAILDDGASTWPLDINDYTGGGAAVPNTMIHGAPFVSTIGSNNLPPEPTGGWTSLS
jgi:hypothetical protein